MSDHVNDPTSARPRYQRTTPMGDGCFTVSTVSIWRCCHTPQTAITGERTGEARFLWTHYRARTTADLDAAHEDQCALFARGEIPLWPPLPRIPPHGPLLDYQDDAHARAT